MKVRILKSPAFSRVGLIGWAMILIGGGWDMIYHLAPLVAHVRWSPFIEALGEFGHTVVFVGMVVVVFAVLTKQSR